MVILVSKHILYVVCACFLWRHHLCASSPVISEYKHKNNTNKLATKYKLVFNCGKIQMCWLAGVWAALVYCIKQVSSNYIYLTASIKKNFLHVNKHLHFFVFRKCTKLFHQTTVWHHDIIQKHWWINCIGISLIMNYDDNDC